MYIKSIIIDGFKSYAKRTEVNGFDPMFNAITGLNGSGKSNILDSICFLLGITNLSQVRATNLQELVYKSGQAGVTKASVSITFDNSDKSPGQCPLGYEQYDELTITRQVVIGGKNKYMINGSNATNSRVSDLFRSVQLNINNPHFLIMQGRITKVLNMKPPEILSMIEEAAGTRLYESKKEQAQKTIEKKDNKLREMDTLLNEEITPALTKLKEERNSFLEYQKITRELEHLNKLYIAYEFIRAEETKQKASVDLDEMLENQKKLEQQLEENENNIAELDKMIHELTVKRDKEAGGAMERLETACKEAAAKSATAKSNVEHERGQLKSEEKKKKELEKNMKDDSGALKVKQNEQQKLSAALTKLEEESLKDAETLSDAQKHLHAVTAGLSKNADGEDATLNDQLMNAQEKIKTAETEEKQAKMKLKHFESEVKKKRNELKSTEKSYEKDKNHYDSMKKDLEKMEKELKAVDYEEGREEALTNKRRQLTQNVHQLQNQVDGLSARNSRLQFTYRDPEKNFDRSRVHGLLARLFKVKDPNTAHALEVACGGRLYNVIVDSDSTAQKLIERGDLRRRHNFIPLNKINSACITNDQIRKAKQLVGDQNVHSALSLIEYDNKLQKAMEFAFGNVFICKDMATANKVAFAPGIMKRAVSLDGDDFNPAGTLTGGAAPQTASILMALVELQRAETQLHEKQTELQQVEDELRKLSKVAERYHKVKQTYDGKFHEAEIVRDRLEKSTHHQQLEDINEMEKTKDEQQQVLVRAQETLKKETERVKDIEHKIKNAKSIRERELKQAEKEVQDVKKRSEESKKKMMEKKQQYDQLELEASDLKKEVESYEEQIKTVENMLLEINGRIDQLNQLAKQIKEEEKAATDAMNNQKDLLKSCDKEINTKLHDQKQLHKRTNAIKIRQEELKHEMNKHDKESKDAAEKVQSMLKKHRWIAEEKKYFGVANTAYDFKANKPKEIHQKINKLTETKDKLSKTINTRAMNMLGKAEEHYNDLMKKRTIVLNDKAKIVRVIEEMDKKKNEALQKAHEQVNKDFGSIFSTLLPGTQAKLVAPDGQTILQGLEVKVAFGEVWKESLSELSGGQRSLVALSLILSMLLFKPAPLYILDEVDAALDLSHTQNIGQMLRTHFKHSQFIVVSLKDGMFNNANVLYKTKFVDGVSTVTRYAQSNANASRNVSNAKDASGRSKAKKARRGNEENEEETVR